MNKLLLTAIIFLATPIVCWALWIVAFYGSDGHEAAKETFLDLLMLACGLLAVGALALSVACLISGKRGWLAWVVFIVAVPAALLGIFSNL